METGYQEHFFDRPDESDDALFYAEPRLVVHIDDEAIAQIGRIFQEVLPPKGIILDLMSSWRSHFPADFPKARLVGLGMNTVEMRENPDLDEYVVHDLNKDPRLPFDDESFDAVILTVSAQYFTKPVEVFRDVNRLLTPNGPLVVTFSNRMFPTKAVRIWQACNDQERMTLLKLYFQKAGGYKDIVAEDRSPDLGYYTDPVFLVMGRKISQGDETPHAG